MNADLRGVIGLGDPRFDRDEGVVDVLLRALLVRKIRSISFRRSAGETWSRGRPNMAVATSSISALSSFQLCRQSVSMHSARRASIYSAQRAPPPTGRLRGMISSAISSRMASSCADSNLPAAGAIGSLAVSASAVSGSAAAAAPAVTANACPGSSSHHSSVLVVGETFGGDAEAERKEPQPRFSPSTWRICTSVGLRRIRPRQKPDEPRTDV
jgi:hypothetical protein